MERGELLVFRFCKDECGAGAIEYGLISCLVALVVDYAVAKGLTPTLVYQWAAVMVKLSGDDDGSATSTLPVRCGRCVCVALQMFEVAILITMFAEVLRLIAQLRPQSLPAPARLVRWS